MSRLVDLALAVAAAALIVLVLIDVFGGQHGR